MLCLSTDGKHEKLSYIQKHRLKWIPVTSLSPPALIHALKEAVLTFDPDSLISVLTLVTGEYRAPQSVRGPAPPEASSHNTTHPPRPPAAALLPLPPTPHLPGPMRKQPFWLTFMTLFRALLHNALPRVSQHTKSLYGNLSCSS